MAIILPVKGIIPKFDRSCFIAQNATLVGDLVLKNNCSVWFNAVIRADVNKIRIGQFTNIQDGAVIHCTYKKTSTEIGDFVSIGHNAIVHGCTIHNHVLVGMGAIVMDKAVIEPFVIIAAGAIVLENTVCETGSIYAGVPARKVKTLSSDQIASLKQLPLNYVEYASWFEK